MVFVEGPEMLVLDFVSRRDSKVHDRRKRVGTSKAGARGRFRRFRTPDVLKGWVYYGILERILGIEISPHFKPSKRPLSELI